MDRRTVRILRAIAAALVFATAAYHLGWGVPRSIIYARAFGAGIPPDPRPFLFLALALALLSGPYLVTRGVVSLRYAYVGGTVLLVGSIAAWVVWHTTGHGAFLADGVSAPASGGGHHHGQRNSVLVILSHFDTEPVEVAIKAIETAAVAIFVTLLWKDPAIVPRERPETESGEASES